MSKKQKQIRNQIITQDKIRYSINDIDQTASVIGCDKKLQQIKIPTSIKHESKKYYVTSISKKYFVGNYIKCIEFPSDSKLRTIEEGAFAFTSIITLPSFFQNPRVLNFLNEI